MKKTLHASPKTQAKDWYFDHFWQPLGRLPDAIHIRLFDMAVNLGQKQAVILLQRAINQHYQKDALKTDGILGKKTRDRAWNMVNQDIDGLIRDQLVCFYIGLCNKRPELRTFYYGWLNRARMDVCFDHVIYQGSLMLTELPFIYQILKDILLFGAFVWMVLSHRTRVTRDSLMIWGSLCAKNWPTLLAV